MEGNGKNPPNRRSSLISKAEFARKVGCSERHAGRLAKTGALKAAAVDRKLDLDHPDVIEWLAKRGIDVETLRFTSGAAKDGDGGEGPPENLPSPRAVLDCQTPVMEIQELTVKEVVDIWGSDFRFERWLSAVQKLAQITQRQLRIHKERGDLISRERVVHSMISWIDTAHRLLLQDMSRTIASRGHALFAAGAPREELEQLVQDVISTQLQATKRRIVEELDIPERMLDELREVRLRYGFGPHRTNRATLARDGEGGGSSVERGVAAGEGD